MDFYKKYLKYKNKYIKLKNTSGGNVDVLSYNKLEHKVNTTSYDNILIQKIGKTFKNAIDNHIHELNGFINLSSGKYYLIENITIKNKTFGENIQINNLDIKDDKIENELYDDITILEQIKSSILIYLYQNRSKFKYMSNIITNPNQTNDIIVNFIKLDTEISGGFNASVKCDNVKLNGLAKIYSEPVINALHEILGNYYYYTLKSLTDKRKFPFKYGKLMIYFSGDRVDDDDLTKYYNNLVEIINKNISGDLENVKTVLKDIKFNKEMLANGDYIRNIMLHHLLNNKYAHNGIEEKDVFEKLSILLGKELLDTSNLLYIHSYLHYLDELNMLRYDKIYNKNIISHRKILRSCIKKSVNILCYENLLNQKQYEFLEKSASNNYILPYKIKKEAFNDKERQYKYNDRIDNIFLQQLYNKKITSTGETDEPYGYYSFLKKEYLTKYPDIIDFINTNSEINKIKIIDKNFRLSKIVNIFNKKYKEITKEDIINLILIFHQNFNYEFESMV